MQPNPKTWKIIEFVKENPTMPYKEIAARMGGTAQYISHIARRYDVKHYSLREKPSIIVNPSAGAKRPVMMTHHPDIYYSGTGCSISENCEEFCPFPDCEAY